MKKIVLLLCSLWAMILTIHAQEVEKDAVYAWVNGTNKCYRLTAMPKVNFDQGAAVLTIDGVEQLRVPAESIDQLTIVYGVYKEDDPNAIEPATNSANSPVRQVEKYIVGGQLIIVVDGVQYDALGRRIEPAQPIFEK